MSVFFLVVTALGLLLTLNAWRPLVSKGALSVPVFFGGWLVSELPVQHVLWQVLATVGFVSAGALDEPAGWVGLGLALTSWVGLIGLAVAGQRAGHVLEAALVETFGADYRSRIRPEMAARIDSRQSWRDLVLPRARRREVRRTKNLAYGPRGRRNRLDVYRHVDEPSGCPVLLQVHGGAWVMGSKEQQAKPLMYHLASLGWVVVSINYRLSPRGTWPDHIVDVKSAIVWVKEHVGEYGGNPEFIVITGGSAGGHLCSLAVLSPNDPDFQPGFEEADTTVQACVPFYGVYDFTNEDQHGRADMGPFLERLVMKKPFRTHRELWERASSIHRLGDGPIPPFFVIHGANDTLVPVRQARAFVERMRGRSTAPVAYAELPGTQHAFELFPSLRTWHTIRAVERWVGVVYSVWLDERDAEAARPRRRACTAG